jgi:uroporphyrinogen decarboxylase
MTRRDVVKMVLDGKQPPYVPWHCGFTKEPLARLSQRLGRTWDWRRSIKRSIKIC